MTEYVQTEIRLRRSRAGQEAELRARLAPLSPEERVGVFKRVFERWPTFLPGKVCDDLAHEWAAAYAPPGAQEEGTR